MKIIYLIPTYDNKPSGGVKVIYKHAEFLQEIGINTNVLHVYKPRFICNWFKHSMHTRSYANFNIAEDFLVIPEVIAGELGLFCLRNNLKYAIFVQNGYLIQKGLGKESKQNLLNVYKNSEIILTISKSTEDYVKNIFNFNDLKKIIRVNPYVENHYAENAKYFLITYMSRKLSEHSRNVLFYLKNKINKKWRFIDIDGFNEDKTMNILNKSKIFLSFSDQEGLGLPPIEAAICKNFVIGYTGRGGDEYFKKPIFTKIDYGDLISFSSKVIEKVNLIENNLDEFNKLNFQKQRKKLISNFSKNEVKKGLVNFSKYLNQINFPKKKQIIFFSKNNFIEHLKNFKIWSG